MAAVRARFRPYEYMSGNNVVGIDVDIANEVARSSVWSLRFSQWTLTVRFSRTAGQG